MKASASNFHATRRRYRSLILALALTVAVLMAVGANVNSFVTTPARAGPVDPEGDQRINPAAADLRRDHTDLAHCLRPAVLGLVSLQSEDGIGDPAGPRVPRGSQRCALEVDRSVCFTSDRVAVKATMRVGFGFPHPLAIVKITHA